jgi:predicted kinase
MTILHLMVGLPCSGKTTLARQLEQQYAALRLTPDEWHTNLFGQDLAEGAIHDSRHSLIETLLWQKVAVRVLALGQDVILDLGFWARSERDDYRLAAAAVGADLKIHFLRVTEETLIERLRSRNAHLPVGTFEIPEAKLREWVRLFEPPYGEELDYTSTY